MTKKETETPANQISNKYRNLSFPEFKDILNKIDTKQLDEDLKYIMDLLIDLTEAISICNQFKPENNSSGFAKSMYQTHYTRIQYITKTLDEFVWFDQLKKTNQRFNYQDQKINN